MDPVLAVVTNASGQQVSVIIMVIGGCQCQPNCPNNSGEETSRRRFLSEDQDALQHICSHSGQQVNTHWNLSLFASF